jgi:tetratricopeptide (TPR) repeat protein
MLDPDGASAIRELLAAFGDQVWGFEGWHWNYVQSLDYRSGGEQAVVNPGTLEQARAYPAYFRSIKTRLFRRDDRIRFTHCVHESVLPSFSAAGLRRARANFIIHHFGYVDDAPGTRAEKGALYHRLAYRKLAASPGDAVAHLEAGIAELDQAKDPQRALAHLTCATSIEPGLHAAWLYRGICLTRLGRYRESLEDLAKAFAADATNPLIHCATADAHLQLGNHVEAQRWYLMAAAHGDRSPVSRAKLGTAEIRAGLCTQGLENVRQAVKEQPASGELLDILSMAALLAGQPRVACEAVERRLALDGAAAFHFLSAATIYNYVGERESAGAILRRGLDLFPGDPELIALSLQV